MKQCLLCLDFNQENLCLPCKLELPWVKTCCSACGRASQSPHLCLVCQQKPAGWNKGIFPLAYEPPLVDWIKRLKFSRQFYQSRILTNLFLEALPPSQRPELLLPVPLHPWRMIWRGFNQSTELARLLSQALKIPYDPRCLKRVKFSAAQRGSNKTLRQSNVSQAFQLTQPLKVSRIALIDDVLTTGETLTDICRAIRLHHPDLHIEAWTMAQVVGK